MKPQMQVPHQGIPDDGEMLSIAELGGYIRRIRRRQGLSQEEAADVVGLEVETISRAEDRRFGRMLRLRKCILKRLVGYTIDGPYYQIRPIERD